MEHKIRRVLRESPIADCTNGPVGTKCVSGEGLRRDKRESLELRQIKMEAAKRLKSMLVISQERAKVS